MPRAQISDPLRLSAQIDSTGSCLMHSLLRVLSRGLGRRRHTFTLTPLSDLSPAVCSWISTGPSPQFQLIPLNGRYPVGWVLFETRVIRRSADCSARLILDFGPGDGEGLVIDIPSARTGLSLIHI